MIGDTSKVICESCFDTSPPRGREAPARGRSIEPKLARGGQAPARSEVPPPARERQALASGSIVSRCAQCSKSWVGTSEPHAGLCPDCNIPVEIFEATPVEKHAPPPPPPRRTEAMSVPQRQIAPIDRVLGPLAPPPPAPPGRDLTPSRTPVVLKPGPSRQPSRVRSAPHGYVEGLGMMPPAAKAKLDVSLMPMIPREEDCSVA